MRVTRRQAIAAGAAMVGAGLSGRRAHAQRKGFRLGGTLDAPTDPPVEGSLVTFPDTDGTQPTLAPANLSFEGYIRMPVNTDIKNGVSATLRPMANGDLHLLIAGRNASFETLLEVDITGLTPNTTMSSAPQGTFTKDWGSFVQGYALVEAGSGYGKRRFGGLYFDPIPVNGKNILWWCYGDNYAPQHEQPTLGATILDDASDSLQSYGPYKLGLAAANNKGRTGFFPIPQWFLNTYSTAMGNKRLGVYGGQYSGNIAAPWGLSAFAFEPFDPRDVPALATWNEATRQPVVTLIHHDVTHAMARVDVRYKKCGFGDGSDTDGDGAYLFADGIRLTTPNGKWGGDSDGTAENDTQRGVWFVDTAARTGMLFAGIQVTPLKGTSNPNDVDGYAHFGYADYLGSHHGTGQPDGTCPHGCFDEHWQTTGPWASSRQGTYWIVPPSQCGQVASGTRNSYACTPSTNEAVFSDLHGDFHKKQSQEFGQWVGFDYSTNRLFMWLSGAKAPYDTYTLGGGAGHSCLAVFKVN